MNNEMQRTARKKAILIIAAGTAGDAVRLASGERVGGLWTFATAGAETERLAQMRAALATHGLRLEACDPPTAAAGLYNVRRAMIVR